MGPAENRPVNPGRNSEKAMPLRLIIEASLGGELAARAASLLEHLASLESVLVAFSGGVDSSLLLAAAVEACPGRVLAVTVSSPVFPARELADARRIARLAGSPHRVVKSDVLASPSFSGNPPDRCYHCKKEIFERLLGIAAGEGLSAVVEGSNVDDLSDYRPGERALRELGIVSPLRQADFTKADVRALSGKIGLPASDRPAMACLASRFPHGTEITAGALARIERLEDLLISLGFRQVRARYHGALVRFEVEPGLLAEALSPDIRDRIVQAARREGFRFVALDLQGYRMGSLNPKGDPK
jgi:uncharacterized protein